MDLRICNKIFIKEVFFMSPENGLLAIFAGAGVTLFLVILALYVLLVIAEWKIFTKAGRPGWAALIPIYNSYVLFDIIYGQGLKFLLLLIPVFGWVVALVSYFRLGQVFGQETGFCIGLVLLSSIFTLILGFGSAQYIGPKTDAFI